MKQIEKHLNALLIVILCSVVLSAYFVQFFYHETPCPLCILQRIAMSLVALTAAMNLFFPASTIHYALLIPSSLFGGAVALRQISLHVCPGFPQFGIPVLGFSLYTWSFFVFICSLAYLTLCLLVHRKESDEDERIPLFGKFALTYLVLIIFANMITTFLQCGLGPCEDVL